MPALWRNRFACRWGRPRCSTLVRIVLRPKSSRTVSRLKEALRRSTSPSGGPDAAKDAPMNVKNEEEPNFLKILAFLLKVKGFDGHSYKPNYIKRRIAVR